jgi:hypothetical protein
LVGIESLSNIFVIVLFNSDPQVWLLFSLLFHQIGFSLLCLFANIFQDCPDCWHLSSLQISETNFKAVLSITSQ